MPEGLLLLLLSWGHVDLSPSVGFNTLTSREKVRILEKMVFKQTNHVQKGRGKGGAYFTARGLMQKEAE